MEQADTKTQRRIRAIRHRLARLDRMGFFPRSGADKEYRQLSDELNQLTKEE